MADEEDIEVTADTRAMGGEEDTEATAGLENQVIESMMELVEDHGYAEADLLRLVQDALGGQ